MDWGSVVAKDELSYILGNPPFAGYSTQTGEQKADILSVCLDPNGKAYNAAGKLDYVAAWYYKAAQFIKGTDIRAAFVSTNSITQGELVAYVWRPLFEDYGISLDFAYRPFKWGNEAKGKAAVFCVIVGFSAQSLERQAKRGLPEKVIYDGEKKIIAKNINPYLVDGPDVFIENRSKAICDVPAMVFGNMPIDGGNFFFNAHELEDFLVKEPGAAKYIRQVYGSKEYINGIKRYCLWLVGANSSDLRKMPLVMDRIEKVLKYRLSSKRRSTQDGASRPSLFQDFNDTDSEYLLVPRISSEVRKYIPMGFVSPDIVTTDSVLIIPDATLYHFGVLTSSVHMAWFRAVCGRLKMDYRYSKNVVYNNFPWPDVTEKRFQEISVLAQGVLDARAQFSDRNFSVLYDPRLPPQLLLEAHINLDRAVKGLYGFKTSKREDEGAIVARLMKLYQNLVEGKAGTSLLA
jgi:hypothetical protein